MSAARQVVWTLVKRLLSSWTADRSRCVRRELAGVRDVSASGDTNLSTARQGQIMITLT